MLRAIISKGWSDKLKRDLKSRVNKARNRAVNALFGYDGDKLKARLRSAGISESDTLLVHSNFKPDSGFRGTPLDLANALVELVGGKGNLLMVSLPFRGAAYDYLALGKPFNVRKTMSMMGLVTEMFRRREGTLRSLHPTHPVLAHGKDAAWLVADHERCLYPCGAGSPFEKIRQLRGKLLFFDVSFQSITFFHHVEDLLKERIPFPIYGERLFSVPAVDANGANHVIQTYAFNKEARRAADKLEGEMQRQGLIRDGRVGNSRFQMATTADVVACFTAMVDAGNLPYGPVTDRSGGRARTMSELKQKLKQFIITEVNPERNLEGLEDDEPLLESGIVDSLGVLKILGFLDEEFGIDLSADQIKLEKFKDISTICALVEQGKK